MSYTSSALTPKRALRIVRPDGWFRLPYSSSIEIVEKGKVVMTCRTGGYTDEQERFRRAWEKGVPTASVRAVKSWTETTTSIPVNDRIEKNEWVTFRVPDGGVLMTDISSKHITDTPMNPFGEG